MVREERNVTYKFFYSFSRSFVGRDQNKKSPLKVRFIFR